MYIEINAQTHPVSAVTVYQHDGALVQRRFPVKLESGQNEIAITRLSKHISDDSIRVEAEGASPTQHLVVFDVTPMAPSSASPIPFLDRDEVEALNEKKDALSADISILEKQQDILEKYGDEIMPTRGGGGNAIFDPSALEKFLDVYGSKRATLNQELVKLRKDQDAVLRRLGELNSKASVANLSLRMPSVSIVMLAKEVGDATIVLSYVVSQASWSSLYDVRAELPTVTSGKGSIASVQLQYRASIRQTTGEDWDQVALTLSTASPTVGSTIPTLHMIRIAPRRQIVLQSLSASPINRSKSKRRSARTLDLQDEMLADAMDFGSFDDGPAITVKEAGLSLTYGIAGNSSIPSNTDWHRVSIANIDLPAELEWITVPRALTSAFIRCRIRNSSTYEFINGTYLLTDLTLPFRCASDSQTVTYRSGPGSVFIDGNFTSRTHLPSVSPGESFSCSLGVDPSLRITYHPIKKIVTSTSAGLIAALSNKKENQTMTFRQRITIKNTRLGPVPRLIVQDQVPVSEDSKVKITVLQPNEKGLGPLNPSAASAMAGGAGSGASVTSTSSLKGSPGGSEATLTTNVSKNVIARWAQKSDEKGGSGGSKGDGIIEWICTDLLDTVDLELAHELSAPIDLLWP